MIPVNVEDPDYEPPINFEAIAAIYKQYASKEFILESPEFGKFGEKQPTLAEMVDIFNFVVEFTIREIHNPMENFYLNPFMIAVSFVHRLMVYTREVDLQRENFTLGSVKLELDIHRKLAQTKRESLESSPFSGLVFIADELCTRGDYFETLIEKKAKCIGTVKSSHDAIGENHEHIEQGDIEDEAIFGEISMEKYGSNFVAKGLASFAVYGVIQAYPERHAQYYRLYTVSYYNCFESVDRTVEDIMTITTRTFDELLSIGHELEEISANAEPIKQSQAKKTTILVYLGTREYKIDSLLYRLSSLFKAEGYQIVYFFYGKEGPINHSDITRIMMDEEKWKTEGGQEKVHVKFALPDDTHWSCSMSFVGSVCCVIPGQEEPMSMSLPFPNIAGISLELVRNENCPIGLFQLGMKLIYDLHLVNPIPDESLQIDPLPVLNLYPRSDSISSANTEPGTESATEPTPDIEPTPDVEPIPVPEPPTSSVFCFASVIAKFGKRDARTRSYADRRISVAVTSSSSGLPSTSQSTIPSLQHQ